MNVLLPLTISALTSSSIAEPDTGEVAWVSAASYTLGDQVIRTTTHKIYECIITHSGRTQLPEADPTYWAEVSPTNRWKPFDTYTSTQATATTSANWVLSPGFFNSVACYGLTGTSITALVKDGPGGATLFNETQSLYEESLGLYEYLFGEKKSRDRVLFDSIPIHPTAELTLTIAAGTGAPVAIGIIVIGSLKALSESQNWGGTQAGASVEPVTYSRITTDEFGNTSIVRRTSATGMRAEVVIPIEDANYALRLVQSVLDVPVAWIAKTDNAKYDGLSVFGLGNTSLAYTDAVHAVMSITVRGMI